MPRVLRFHGLVSRFSVKCNVQPKTHTVYVQFDPDDFSETITFCDCKSGARTAGGCAHSVAILTYIYYKVTNQTPAEYHPYATKVFETVKDVRNFKKRLLDELSTDDLKQTDSDTEITHFPVRRSFRLKNKKTKSN